MFKQIAASALVLLSCAPSEKPELKTAQKKCEVHDGKYPVQSTVFNKTKETYEVHLLRTPSCFPQPAQLTGLKLDRLEETDSENAVIEFIAGQATNLLIKKDYAIKTVETIVENGKEVQTESSWSPFLSGLAGGAVGGIVGGMIADKISGGRNQNPTPGQAASPANNTQNVVQYGNSNLNNDESSKKPAEVKTYQRKQDTAKKSTGFFKKKRRR